jgi:murein DD-endopeptidase MepM/ murein hydrolase activator NlpD
VGQDLTRGQVIAHLGNSGNSDAPHLHFHIMDSPLPLASNGLPFEIRSFTLAGSVSPDAIQACTTSSVACTLDTSVTGAQDRKSPLYGDLMDYPER